MLGRSHQSPSKGKGGLFSKAKIQPSYPETLTYPENSKFILYLFSHVSDNNNGFIVPVYDASGDSKLPPLFKGGFDFSPAHLDDLKSLPMIPTASEGDLVAVGFSYSASWYEQGKTMGTRFNAMFVIKIQGNVDSE